MTEPAEPDVTVVDNPAASRYELHLDDRVIGVADYRRRDGTVVIPHVEVDPAHGGRGHGHRLVSGVLDDIRSNGEQVEPLCPFVRAYIAENPDDADLVVPSTEDR